MQMDGRALRSVVREVDDYLCQTNYHQLASHDDGVGGADDRGSGGGFVFRCQHICTPDCEPHRLLTWWCE